MNALSCLLVAIYMVYAQGSEFYNPETQQCCGDTISEMEGSTSSCCGSTSYNYMEQACCGDELFEFPTEGSTSFSCCYNEDTEKMSAYDPTTQVCCNGEIKENKDNNGDMSYDCCGGDIYSYNEKICCGGELHDKNGYEMQCCADKVLYNSSSELCCTKYIPLPDYKYEIEYQTYDIENNQNRYEMSCCGVAQYNTSSDYCCWDDLSTEVRPRPDDVDENTFVQCCGDDHITNYTSQICKDREIFPRPSPSHYFCGEELVDGNIIGCCMDEPYEYGSEIQCCYSANKTYNSNTESCCGDEVAQIDAEDKINNRTSCCFDYSKLYGPQPYRKYHGNK